MTAVYIFLGFAAMAIVCFVIGAGDWARTQRRIWREKRAIARRDAVIAKREADALKWGFFAYPRKSMRVSKTEIDPAQRTAGQFDIPACFRDMKGVQR